jgi:hypothetical protein
MIEVLRVRLERRALSLRVYKVKKRWLRTKAQVMGALCFNQEWNWGLGTWCDDDDMKVL